MWSSRSASVISSSVERNAFFRSTGRLRMNPTVSVTMVSFSLGNLKRREAVSRVAKSLSSTRVELFVRVLRSVDFPAFVYPTIDIIGISLFALFLLLSTLPRLRFLSSFSSCIILSVTLLLSTSSFVSPGPVPPMPPGMRPLGEDIQYQLGPVYYLQFRYLAEFPYLRGGQFLVEYDKGCPFTERPYYQFLYLALAHKVTRTELFRPLPDSVQKNDIACFGKRFQFRKVVELLFFRFC